MESAEPTDPALALQRRAEAEGWPLRCDGALHFERPELNDVRDIWFKLAADNHPPSRTEFDARTLKPFLRNVTIIERVAADAGWRYRTRLSGSAIVEIIGNNTGQFLEDSVTAETIPQWAAVYDTVILGRQPLRLCVDFTYPRIEHLCAEALFAPLADPRGAISLALGCAYFKPKRH